MAGFYDYFINTPAWIWAHDSGSISNILISGERFIGWRVLKGDIFKIGKWCSLYIRNSSQRFEDSLFSQKSSKIARFVESAKLEEAYHCNPYYWRTPFRRSKTKICSNPLSRSIYSGSHYFCAWKETNFRRQFKNNKRNTNVFSKNM